MAGRYTGSYLERLNGWRAVAIRADIGQASLVERIPRSHLGSDDGSDNQHIRRTARWNLIFYQVKIKSSWVPARTTRQRWSKLRFAMIRSESGWPRIIAHADMDAFYAAIEQLDDPTLRGKPVLLG